MRQQKSYGYREFTGPSSAAHDGEQYTGSDRRTYHAGHIGSHGVHQQEIVVIGLQPDLVHNACRHRPE